MTISVAMAVYNGEKYLKEQINSILMQLKEVDELVISYNPCDDSTEDIIRNYECMDSRVKVFLCKDKGIFPNFENAIRNCSNEIIFLSDQDDIWRPNKITVQIKYFKEDSIGGVIHDCLYIDCEGKPCAFQPRKMKKRIVNPVEIVIRNPVQGSCLAFRKKMVDCILPIPVGIPMHDSWIGLKISLHSKLLYIEDKLLLYRQHSGNITSRKHKKMIDMTKDRLILVRQLLYSEKQSK